MEAKEETISELRDQVGFLRRELERKDTLLMTLMQRVPELEAPREAPSEPRESPVAASDGGSKGEGTEREEHPSWWRRLFGSGV